MNDHIEAGVDSEAVFPERFHDSFGVVRPPVPGIVRYLIQIEPDSSVFGKVLRIAAHRTVGPFSGHNVRAEGQRARKYVPPVIVRMFSDKVYSSGGEEEFRPPGRTVYLFKKSQSASCIHKHSVRGRYFFAMYFLMSKETAATMMSPLTMSCQYGFTPMKVSP